MKKFWLLVLMGGTLSLFLRAEGLSRRSSAVPLLESENRELSLQVTKSQSNRRESEDFYLHRSTPMSLLHRVQHAENGTVLSVPPPPYDVLLLVADTDQPTLRTILQVFPDIDSVDYFDARASTPTLSQLLAYEAVITWPNSSYLDEVATGDTLSAYVDRGGAVVCGAWCWFTNGNSLGGEIMSPSYNPFTGNGGNHYSVANLGWNNASHPIMNGVSAVSDQYRDSLSLNPGVLLSALGSDSVAKWDDGEWLVGTLGRVVYVNAVPGDGYGWTGDLITLFHNAVIWGIEYGPPQYAIFQDRNPWDYTMNQGLLNANGIPYLVFNSSEIGSINLTPFSKVIIASQQTLAFYTTVSVNRAWFESYVNGGGVLEFHGATWFPVDDWAGLTMPGNFTCGIQDSSWSDSVSIQTPGHPIVTLPNLIPDAELDGWNYSTHSYLISFGPPQREILRNDTYSQPCLVEFPWGSGAIIATMNTLEWAHGNSLSRILENVLLYQPQDAGVVTLDAPGDTVFTDSTYPVMATVHNYGNTDVWFDVVATIDGYEDTFNVIGLAPGTDLPVTFANWIVPSLDSTTYTMRVCTYVPWDIDPVNDCVQKSIFAYTSVGVEEGADNEKFKMQNAKFALYQNHPNPFHHSTRIHYQIPSQIPVTLGIYDLTGGLVKTLVNETQESGSYQVEWESKGIPSGVYFYRLVAGEFTSTRKLVLLR